MAIKIDYQTGTFNCAKSKTEKYPDLTYKVCTFDKMNKMNNLPT